MQWLRRLVAPSNSLLLYFDHLPGADLESFHEQIEQVGQHYRFAKLSEIATPSPSRGQGLAAVLFGKPRKSLFLRALPVLLGKNIPVTTFIDPDCVGVNRLPLQEELRAIRDAYPDKQTTAQWEAREKSVWEHPQEMETWLGEWRRSVGPFPVEKTDPTLFPVTWGKILEIPEPLKEIGWDISFRPDLSGLAEEALRFVEKQTGARPRMAFHPGPPEGRAALERLGIQATVTRRSGSVEKNTSLWDLPVWDFGDPVP